MMKINEFEQLIAPMGKRGLNVLLGTDQNRKTIYTDLAKTGHIAIDQNPTVREAMMHTMICSLICRIRENPCSIVIISPDNDKFSVYEQRPEVSIASNMDEAMGWLGSCSAMFDARRDHCENRGYSNIYEANDPFVQPIVVFIDDANYLLDHGRCAEGYFVQLERSGAQYGIHLIFGIDFAKSNVRKTNIEKLAPAKILHRNGIELVKNGVAIPLHLTSIYLDNEVKEKAALAAADSDSASLNRQNEILRKEAKENTIAVKWTRSEEPKPTVQRQNVQSKARKPRRMGLFRTIYALWNTKPIMFVSSEYPIRIK